MSPAAYNDPVSPTRRRRTGDPTIEAAAEAATTAGTVFTDLDEIKTFIRRELARVTAYWQVRVLDQAGTVVHYGFRAGINGTGETWTWRPAT